MQPTIRLMLLCGSGIVCILAGQVMLPANEPVSALQALAEGSQPEPTRAELDAALQEATAKLDTWRKSFKTLKHTYKTSYPTAGPEKQSKWETTTEITWNDRDFCRRIDDVYENGVETAYRIMGQNDRVHWELSCKNSQLECQELKLLPIDASYRFHSASQSWHSWALGPNQNLTFIDRTHLEPIKPIGLRVIHGAKCVGFVYVDRGTSPIWLDLEHDGLVRLVGGQTYTSWECVEVQKTSTGQWFPKAVLHRYGTTKFEDAEVIEVLDVEFNPEVADDEFEPPAMDDATKIVGEPALLTREAHENHQRVLAWLNYFGRFLDARQLPKGLLVVAFMGIIAVAFWRQRSAAEGDTAKK